MKSHDWEKWAGDELLGESSCNGQLFAKGDAYTNYSLVITQASFE